jgi:Ni,Fe-hydrogenase III large subunit
LGLPLSVYVTSADVQDRVLVQTSETFIEVAMIRLILRRLAKGV